MDKPKEDLVISATYPRRVARLLAYISVMAAGLLYLFYPPVTVIYQLDSVVPARMWGGFLLVGGSISFVAWFWRALIFDRIGLSLILIALFSITVAQVELTFASESWTHGGRTLLVIFAIFLVMARWRDVRHDEKVHERSIRETTG